MHMASNQNGPAQAGGASAGGLATERPARRVVILNALPLNSLPRAHLELDVLPVEIRDLAQWVNRRLAEGYQLVHYVRHTSTIATLRATGIQLSEQPNAGLYVYQPGDVIIVVSLRAPMRGQEQQNIRLEDLESWIVTVL
jgi:hypothetical protein